MHFNSILRKLIAPSVVILVLAISACGGGGGDSTSNTGGLEPSLSIDKETLTFDSNSTETITVTATNSIGTTDTITAISSDTSVATVSVSGLVVTVTGIKAGSTTITITSGSGLSETCEATLNASWHTVFEDNFSGNTFDTTNWLSIYSSPAPYSLTGSGELEISGETGDDEDGACFVYNTDVISNYSKITVKFRTTQGDPVEDDVDILLLLNSDGTFDYCYGLVLTSDPDGSGSRDYSLLMVKVIGGVETDMVNESVGGTSKPQIVASTDYILEGINNNGNLSFTLKDSSGNVIKSVSATDTSLSNGKFGFDGDLNIGTSGSQSIFFDYSKIEVYK